MSFSHNDRFKDALAAIKREGRYRVFADIMRARGDYPKADFYTDAEGSNGGGRPITVWCSNDYLNMGQHPKVLAAMHAQIDRMAYAHTSFFSTEVAEELADQLVRTAPAGQRKALARSVVRRARSVGS